ncbi:MAG: RsmB/NOP family class I SAM-dependent RNA methyltransferase, partial [Pseudomonadota bacterium]
ARYAGSKDRRAVADLVYDCLRRRRSLAWASGAEGGRGLLHGLAAAEGWPLDAVFSGEGHAPGPLTEDEKSAGRGAPPDPVRYDHPDWLEAPLKASLGDAYAAAMAAMAARAPVDLRVNRLKTDRDGALAALAEDGVEAAPLAEPDAIRCPPGARVAASSAFRDGLVELQDAASQAVARAAAPRPGDAILDYCAGGGGKALAFASLTAEGGVQRARVVAHDVEPKRMADIPARAARAGARIEVAGGAALAAMGAVFDLVFVDAPCSGSGSWRRDPEGKWRLTETRFAELIETQREAFRAARAFLRPGGRIAYATCSQLDAENRGQTAFLLRSDAGLSLIDERAFRTDQGADGLYVALFAT